MQSKEEIQREIVSTLADVFGFPVQDIKPETRLVEDLELDSIDAIDFAVKIEKRVGYEFNGPELRDMHTVWDIVELVHAHQEKVARAPAKTSASTNSGAARRG